MGHRGVLLTCEGVGSGSKDGAPKASNIAFSSVKGLVPSRIVSAIHFVAVNDARKCHPGPIQEGRVPGPCSPAGAEPLKVPYI